MMIRLFYYKDIAILNTYIPSKDMKIQKIQKGQTDSTEISWNINTPLSTNNKM